MVAADVSVRFHLQQQVSSRKGLHLLACKEDLSVFVVSSALLDTFHLIELEDFDFRALF